MIMILTILSASVLIAFLLTAKCQPNPCINGTCVAIGSSSFKCQCRVGYTGDICQSSMIMTLISSP